MPQLISNKTIILIIAALALFVALISFFHFKDTIYSWIKGLPEYKTQEDIEDLSKLPKDAQSKTPPRVTTSFTYKRPIIVDFGPSITEVKYRYNPYKNVWEYSGGRLFGWGNVKDMGFPYAEENKELAKSLLGKNEKQGLEIFFLLDMQGVQIKNFPNDDFGNLVINYFRENNIPDLTEENIGNPELFTCEKVKRYYFEEGSNEKFGLIVRINNPSIKYPYIIGHRKMDVTYNLPKAGRIRGIPKGTIYIYYNKKWHPYTDETGKVPYGYDAIAKCIESKPK